ncbi:MAG: tRNA (N(6)-L-threonylcarbamoyladenosine(37)-C(2))-methylthiotransferase MtaB [Coriobacteriaceae bacterium]|nr:tRNA (N(6)-L-threonylcarbamoyladenosine(37)-C(2))-methylthiotransferase MtaB [Coriobacteriaceae bacterium]
MSAPLVCVVNLGCRVNRVESDRISCDLARAGVELVDEASADIVVINTCAVTAEAESKTRKAVRRALSGEREPMVVVTGCVVNLHADELTDLSARVVAEPMKADVCARVLEIAHSTGSDTLECEFDMGELLGRSRIGVKIQDGCNNRCTYCIVWKARGPERSVPVETILAQVNEAVRAGFNEVVLTGVNLGAYDGERSGDSHVEIDELVQIIMENTDLAQLRLSSIEPMDVSERLLKVMARYRDRIAPFLHIPLQSGCTSTLRRMARPYSAERFMQIVQSARCILPDIALSCDVIVGFPGETEEEFEESYRLCERVGFSRMHVFRYSKRPGTPAAAAADQIGPHIMAARSSRLRELAHRMALADAAKRLGTQERAVIENGSAATLESFHRVLVEGGEDLCSGELVSVRLKSLDESGVLHGSVVRAR